jgi:hypothetical protein
VCGRELTEPEIEEFKEFKLGVLRNILDYYSERAKNKHKVDAIVQAFVGVINIQYEDQDQNQIWTKQCDLPHRRSPENALQWYKSPNPGAVGLGLLAFFFQMIIPPAMMHYQLARDPETYVYLSEEEFLHNLCPFAFHSVGEGTATADIIHAILLKLTSGALLWHLHGCLRQAADDEWEIFKINWQCHALPKHGLLWSRVQNTVVFYLVIFTTIILFFQGRNFADMFLNYLAMDFLMNIDDDLAEVHQVPQGIGTLNDSGRKIVLSYIASGVRDTTKMETFFDRFSSYFSTFGYIFFRSNINLGSLLWLEYFL